MGGVGPIPWSSVDRYAERARLNDAERDEFLRLIEAMDAVYLEHAAAETRKATEHGERDGHRRNR